jgi:hypothetical protein
MLVLFDNGTPRTLARYLFGPKNRYRGFGSRTLEPD